MKKTMKLFGASLLALVISLQVTLKAQASASEAPANKIQWLTFEEAVEKMEESPKKIIIDVYTDWCGWCKRMDATTFHDPVIMQNINENYYAVKMDGEYKQDITFKGRTYKYVAQGRRGYHELPAELMNGRMSYPTIVFLDEEYGIIQPLPGYRGAKEMDLILTYFGGDFYKNTPFEQFSAEYKSPFGDEGAQ